MMDASVFNFDNIAAELGTDPFAEKTNTYARDERFYVLKKNEKGEGAAIIRFLPDSERSMIQQVYKINTTIIKNDKKRFVNEFAPTTIGLPCPFQEKWQELWNSGDKEGAKTYGRGIKYLTNIKVIKDPLAPENEGKIFILELSGRMKDKIQQALNPSQQDRDLGAEPKELFNPIKGYNFKLACKPGANGIISYDSSDIVPKESSIYDSVEEALEDIKNNTYKLSDFTKPEAYLSYEELQKKLEWVTFSDSNTPTVATVQPAVATSEPAKVETSEPAKVETVTETKTEEKPKSKSDDLASLLDGLV